jgi:teichuronic acid biosynthesis glycosyltransferase TuaH
MKKMINEVDIIFTNSPSLYRLKKKLHPHVFQVPQGCNVDLFLKTKKKSVPPEFRKIPSPHVTFIGNVDHRLDFPLIKSLAKNNPSWSFIFIGPIHKDTILAPKTKLEENLSALKKIKNIHFLSSYSKKKIIHFLDHSQLGFIPYDIRQEFCRYSYPMKVFEYFARGLPVISTPIESLKPLAPYVALAKNAKEFAREIKKILKNDWPEKYKKAQKELAMANSWENKIEKINQILEKENFLK